MSGSSAFRKALEEVPKREDGDDAAPLRIKASDLPDPLSGFEEYEAQLRALSEPATAAPDDTGTDQTDTDTTDTDNDTDQTETFDDPESQPVAQPVMHIVAPVEPEQLVLGFDDDAAQHLNARPAPAETPVSNAGLAPNGVLRDIPLDDRVRAIESALPIALDSRSITPAALSAAPPAQSIYSPSTLTPLVDRINAPAFSPAATEPGTRRRAFPSPSTDAANVVNSSVVSWSLLAAAALGALVLFFGLDQAWFTLGEHVEMYLLAGLGAIAAVAGITIAGRRDVISWSTLADIATLTVAVGAFSWQFPRFAPGTTVWNPDERLPLMAFGAAIGLLVAAIIVLALLRRPPSVSSIAFVGALGAVLARLVFEPERPDIVLPLIAASAALTVIAWAARKRGERSWEVPPTRLRVPRSILSLASAAVAAIGVQITLSRGDFNDAIPVIVLFVLVLVASLFSIFSSRNELREEEGAMADWLSWRKELQSGDFETSIFEYSPTANPGMSEWTSDGRLVHGDELFWRMLDLAPADHCDLLASVHADDRVDAAQAFVRAVRSGTQLSHRCRFQRDSDGMVRAFEMRGEPLQNGTYRLSLFELSPDEAKDGLVQSGSAAGRRHDPLTGVANIARLDQWLHEFALNSRRHSDAALIIIVEVGDLALFEQADPRVRDLVLTESAHRLQSACRDGDFVAHVDGPYFAVVAKLATPADEAGLVHRIQQLISGTIPVFGQELAMNGRLIPLHVDPGVVLDQVLDTAAAAFHTSGG